MLDSNTTQALLLSYVAALGTTVGGGIILAFPRLNFEQLGILAGLAAGLMLSMIFFELIPEALESISFNLTNVSGVAAPSRAEPSRRDRADPARTD